jgi:biotin carboxyl carrier protein
MKSWKIGEETIDISARPARGPGLKHRYVVDIGGEVLEVDAIPTADGRLDIRMPDGGRVLASVVATPGVSWVAGLGRNLAIREAKRGGAQGQDSHGSLEAPMPGKVVAIKVAVGDIVEKGATLLTVEAMKMEHALKAPRRGLIEAIPVAVGDLVSPGRPLVTLGDAPA